MLLYPTVQRDKRRCVRTGGKCSTSYPLVPGKGVHRNSLPRPAPKETSMFPRVTRPTLAPAPEWSSRPRPESQVQLLSSSTSATCPKRFVDLRAEPITVVHRYENIGARPRAYGSGDPRAGTRGAGEKGKHANPRPRA